MPDSGRRPEQWKRRSVTQNTQSELGVRSESIFWEVSLYGNDECMYYLEFIR